MPSRRGSICGRLIKDLPLGCLQGTVAGAALVSTTMQCLGSHCRVITTVQWVVSTTTLASTNVQWLATCPETWGRWGGNQAPGHLLFFSSLLLSSLELSDTTIYEP